MRNFASPDRRLREIEGRRGMGTIRLSFGDGTTRGIQIARDYQLKFFCDVCSRLRAFPQNHLQESPRLHRRWNPTTQSDQLIDLLAAAESIETEDGRFLETIHGLCKKLGGRRAGLRGEMH